MNDNKHMKHVASFAAYDVCEEDRVCPKHGEYRATVAYIRGVKVHESECPLCKRERESSPAAKAAKAEQVRIEEQRKQAAEREKIATISRRAGIPEEFLGKDFGAFKPLNASLKEALRQARLYADNFEKIEKKGVGFCFYGQCGTGKTMLACALLQELAKKGVQGLYRPLWDVMAAVMAADRYGGDKSEFLAIRKARFLVIDEMGVQNGSNFEERCLMPIIDERSGRHLPTVYVTNLVPDIKPEKAAALHVTDTLRAKLGYRLYNRISGSSVFLLFRGESQRRHFTKIDDLLKD